MKRILHFSDLHITSDMPDPNNNPIILKLIEKVRTSFKKIHALVFTGDLIDSLSISEKIKKYTVDERAQKWNEEAKKAFELGKRYLTYIKNELGLSDNEIIVCVGNHDVNRYCNEEIRLSCHKSNAITYKGRFDIYQSFSDSFLPFKDSHKTYFRCIGDFRFLVINSNWNNINKSRLCINCNEIEKVLEANVGKLNKNKNFNIVVSHSPISDFCEEARYEYLENSYMPINNKIKSNFNIRLAGDKHTHTFDAQEQIVGAPLSSNNISYGLYEFSNDNFHLKHLNYNGYEWEIETDTKSIQEVYNLSKSYLKQSGLDILYKIENVDDETIISRKYRGCEKQWEYFNDLFLSYTTLKKTEIGTSGTKHSVEDNLIFAIFEIINSSKSQYPLFLRGMPKSGKSLFLTLLYLYLLEMYANNRLNYIPVYFNLDISMSKLDKDNWEYVKECIDNIFENSKNLSINYNKPICFILDGLCKCKYYDVCIEDYVQSKIDAHLKYNNNSNKFVICMDTDEDLRLVNTDINRSIESDYILYFSPININKTYPKSNLDKFIESFTNLYSVTKKEIIINNIRALDLHYIDLHSLIKFKKYFTSIASSQCCITELYITYAMQVFGKQNIRNASLACYKLYYENKTYDAIINDGCIISHSCFEVIKKEKSLAMFLIAKCYVTAIENLQSNNHNSYISPILNECFCYEITTFIKGLIIKNSLSEKLKDFSKNYYQQLNFKGKAMITYFTGRTIDDNKKLSDTLTEQFRIIKRIKTPRDNEDSFFKKVAQRSIYISRISGLIDYKTHEEQYIEALISNQKMRYVNREFYLLYYGDRKSNELTFNYRDTLYEGFDFYNVFHILVTKLEKWKTNPIPSRLLRLEFFTLCDLIQQRIDNSTATTRNNRAKNKDVYSFFYDCRIIDKAKYVLDTTISLIEAYLSFDSSNNLFTSYLNVKHEEFQKFLIALNTDDISSFEQGYQPATLFNESSNISFTHKIGWKISKIENRLTDSSYEKYSKNISYETVSEHMYECYLIGLFYLPEVDSNNPEYNKQDVLNLLLIHDIGESVVNDYPPYYEKIEEKKKLEDSTNHKFFLSGLHEGVADLTQQFRLWANWHDETNINAKIAKDIDKIQMIYKMFILLSKTDMHLSKNRIFSITKDKERIKTIYGKHIYNILISQNSNIDPKFKRYL